MFKSFFSRAILSILLLCMVSGAVFRDVSAESADAIYASSSTLSTIVSALHEVWEAIYGLKDAMLNMASGASVPVGTLSTDIQNLTQTLVSENDIYNRDATSRTPVRLDKMLSIATERKALMLSVLEQDPAVFLTLAMEEEQRGKFPQTVIDKIEGAVVVQGELDVLVFDYPDYAVTTYTLIDPLGKRIKLSFVGQPNIPESASRVQIAGIKLDANLVSEVYSGSVRMLSRANVTTGERKLLIILANFQDNAGSKPYTSAEVSSLVFTPNTATTGVNAYHYENSYQKAWFTGNVVGWFTLPFTVGTNCDSNKIFDEAVNAADPSVDFTNYTNVMVLFPRINCSYNGSGALSPVDIKTLDNNQAPISILKSWVNEPPFLSRTIAHELGHNFGVHHAGALECGVKTLDVVSTNCSLLEYANPLDVMGAAQAYHFHAGHKNLSGWFVASNIMEIKEEDKGTYTASIGPIETPGSEVKTLKIFKETVGGIKTWFYVENREAIGFDAGLSGVTSATRGLIVNIVSDKLPPGAPTKLLDFTPNSRSNTIPPEVRTSPDFADAALAPNQTFSDPVAGVTIKHLGNSGALLNVQVIKSTVSNRAPSISLSNPSFGGSIVSLPVTFTATADDPDGWGNIQHFYFLISGTAKKTTAAPYVHYNKNTNKLYLRNDADTGWAGSCTPGTQMTLENIAAKLDCGASTITGSTNTLTAKFVLTFKQGAVGTITKNIFVKVRDIAGVQTNWVNVGTWLVGSNTGPSIGTIEPVNGISKPNEIITISMSANDQNGWANIKKISLLVNTSTAVRNGAFVEYDANTNKLTLYGDNGTAIAGSCTPGTLNFLSNSVIEIFCLRTAITGSGKNLTVYVRAKFSSIMIPRATQNTYLSVTDDSDVSIGWTNKGTWIVQN